MLALCLSQHRDIPRVLRMRTRRSWCRMSLMLRRICNSTGYQSRRTTRLQVLYPSVTMSSSVYPPKNVVCIIRGRRQVLLSLHFTSSYRADGYLILSALVPLDPTTDTYLFHHPVLPSDSPLFLGFLRLIPPIISVRGLLPSISDATASTC